MDISLYLRQPDLLKQTADQLIKDFGLIGIAIAFPRDACMAYEELFGQVEPHIDNMLTRDRQKFLELLYRIDLSETQIRKATQEQEAASTPFSHLITDLVLKRELQKVVIRNYYKNK